MLARVRNTRQVLLSPRVAVKGFVVARFDSCADLEQNERVTGLSPDNIRGRPSPFSLMGAKLCAMLIYSEAEDPQPEPTPTPDPDPDPEPPAPGE